MTCFSLQKNNTINQPIHLLIPLFGGVFLCLTAILTYLWVQSMKDIIPIKIVDLGEGGFHIFCSVIIEKNKVNALIDTGANRSVLTSNLADSLNSIEEYEMEQNHTSGIGKEEVETSFIILDHLGIGEIEINQQVLGLIDLDHVREMYEQMEIEPFEMIIGGDILNSLQAIIDYGTLSMTLTQAPD
jgi:hypothetical protein